MTILFSPVGTADPITQLGDGPMLHLVRHRSPDKVVLFLSPAMANHQRKDQRYTKSIEWLCDTCSRPYPEVVMEESDHAEVFQFDHYIEEFEKILSGLAENSAGEPILVNVSSGTPAMEQALVALAAFGRLDLKLLQVTTPKNGINERHDREDPDNYDLESLCVWDEEVENKSESRVHEVELPNFSDRLLLDNVVALVKRYEYEGASMLIDQVKDVDPHARKMIKAAAARLNLEGQLPAKVFGGTGLGYKANDLLAEYLYIMEVRLAQGRWADFLRSMTPALTETMKNCLRPYLNESRYLKLENGKLSECIDYDKVRTDEELSHVFDCERQGRYITNEIRAKLIKEFCEDDDVKSSIEKLRTVERESRNLVAHEIKPSGKKSLEGSGKMSFDEVMEHLFRLHGNAKPGMYDRINEAILTSL